jgi:hypothetical protein
VKHSTLIKTVKENKQRAALARMRQQMTPRDLNQRLAQTAQLHTQRNGSAKRR